MFAKHAHKLQAPKGRRVAAAPAAVRKTKADAKPVNPLYEKRNKHFGKSHSRERFNQSCGMSRMFLPLSMGPHASQEGWSRLTLQLGLSASQVMYRRWWSPAPKEGSAQAGQVAEVCPNSEAKACPGSAIEGSPCANPLHKDFGQEHSSNTLQALAEVST